MATVDKKSLFLGEDHVLIKPEEVSGAGITLPNTGVVRGRVLLIGSDRGGRHRYFPDHIVLFPEVLAHAVRTHDGVCFIIKAGDILARLVE